MARRVASPKKRTRRKEAKTPKEPKVRKKPGPKPGWKKPIKSERYNRSCLEAKAPDLCSRTDVKILNWSVAGSGE